MSPEQFYDKLHCKVLQYLWFSLIIFQVIIKSLFCVYTGGYDLDTVPVRDTSPRRNGTPDSGWDDDDEELDLGLGKDCFVL